jgi:hypothetical protein
MKRHKYYYKKKIEEFIKNNTQRKVLISLKNNSLLNYHLRQHIISKLHIKYKFNNFNRLKIFCLVTGKTRSVMGRFKINKMVVLEDISEGMFAGFYKN